MTLMSDDKGEYICKNLLSRNGQRKILIAAEIILYNNFINDFAYHGGNQKMIKHCIQCLLRLHLVIFTKPII